MKNSNQNSNQNQSDIALGLQDFHIGNYNF